MTLSIGSFLNFNFPSILLFSGCLAFSDYLRAKILTGFPWNLWIYSFSWITEIIQILDKFGLFAFNLVSITIFLTPSVLFFKINPTQKLFAFILMILTLFLFYIYGDHTLNQNKKFLEKIDKKV